jgi:hypothetical protein
MFVTALLFASVCDVFGQSVASQEAQKSELPDDNNKNFSLRKDKSRAEVLNTTFSRREIQTAFNQFLAINVAANGRFNMGAFPTSTGGLGTGSYDLIYSWPSTPSTSFTTLRVDGINQTYGSSSGSFTEPPADISAGMNRSKWKTGDIEVTQNLEIVTNPQSGREDLARIAYTIVNTGNVLHSVGLRMILDTEINYNDGAPYRVPGAGIINTEMEFLGDAVPDNFQAFFNVTDSQRVTTGILRSSGATSPDRLVFAAWSGIVNTQFDYSITPGRSVTSDSAYAVYWNPSPLA